MSDFKSPGNAGDHGVLYDYVADPCDLFVKPQDLPIVWPPIVDWNCHPIESRPANAQPGPNLPTMTENEMERLTQYGPRFFADMLTPTVKHV